MIKETQKPAFASETKNVRKEITRLREELEDLSDYLDLLEARAKNQGQPQIGLDELRKRLN